MEVKVLIGTPIEESKVYCVPAYFRALRDLELGDHEVSVLLVLTRNPTIVFKAILAYETKILVNIAGYEEVAVLEDLETRDMKNRIEVAAHALKKIKKMFFNWYHADVLFNVDADNPPPRNALSKLLSLGADIAGGLIYQRPRGNFKATPLVFKYMYPKPIDSRLVSAWELGLLKPMFNNGIPEEIAGKVIEADAIGLGCSVISGKVLKDVDLKRGKFNSISPEFCHQAKLRGYTVKVDLCMHVPHLMPGGRFV